MPTIIYHGDDKTVQTEANQSILQVSLAAGIPHAHACGGYARCSTCRILILDGLTNCLPRNQPEQRLANKLHFTPEIRLACQTMPQGDLTVRRLVLDDEDIELTSQLKQRNVPTSAGEEKKIAILFADIRGFTTFAEARLPYDVVHALNRYFYEMGNIIQANGGYIDNYMGDGLMALFGVNNPDQAAYRAVKAGYEMVQAMDTKLKPYLELNYKIPLDIGVGIHYGMAVVGSLGATHRKKVTAIGDAVNLASRIESANKQIGTQLLISQDTYREIKPYLQVDKITKLTLKGKSGEYKLYEVTGITDLPLANITEPTQEVVSPPIFWRELVKLSGSLLLGIFFMGNLAAIAAGQGIWLIFATLVGFMGVVLLFWEYLLRETKL